jgi:DNA (cytosine-5)-methyltransferase 1
VKATAVDLFSGAGGMSLGLQSAGFEVVFAVDNWQPAIVSYSRNFRHHIHALNVAELTGVQLARLTGVPIGELDLLAGGPPCQGFSIQRIGGDVDERNDLVLHYARLVSEYRPRLFLMENVPGLLGKRGSAIMRRFEEIVSQAGYNMLVTKIDAADFGVAQNRRRILVYGWRKGERAILQPVANAATRTVREALNGLPPASPPGTKNPSDSMHVESRLSDLNRERLRHIPQGGGFEDLPVELRVNCHKNGASVIGHRSVYGRLHYDRPAGVITARFDSFTRGRFAHPSEDRNITLREGARLQSFPDDFEFVGNREDVAAQIGNAIPPQVARIVGQALLRHLRATRGVTGVDATDTEQFA